MASAYPPLCGGRPRPWRRADGVYKTARDKRLNYGRVQALLSKSVPARTDRPTRPETPKANDPAPSAQFVAVQMKPAAVCAGADDRAHPESGERMRIESACALDLAGVVQAFWRQS